MATAQAVTRGDLYDWTPARWFMVVSALWHLPLGVVGLAIDRSFPIGRGEALTAPSEHIFGIFETNGWHSSLALLLGVVSLYLAVRPARARTGALVIGLLHVGVVVSLELWGPATFWIASNTADQIVHSSTAVAGTAAGLLTRRSAPAS